MTRYILLAFVFVLSSCGTSPHSTNSSSEQKRVPAREGFYEVPASLRKTSFSVGLYFAYKTNKIPKELVDVTRAGECGTAEGRLWRGDMCERILDKACDNGCEVTTYYPRCSGGRIGDHFVTARHCFPESVQKIQVKFMAADGSLITVPMKTNNETYHNLPYDLTTISPVNPQDFEKIPSLEIGNTMADGDSVFGIGFPVLREKIRTQKSADYEITSGLMRVTVGKIVNANLSKKSYCAYSNLNNTAQPENWILEDDCSRYDYTKIDPALARAEHNPMLTDTDMIFGMSGSLLFSQDGKVLGVGSTVKTSYPGNYSENSPAIYSKIENLKVLLRTMKK